MIPTTGNGDWVTGGLTVVVAAGVALKGGGAVVVRSGEVVTAVTFHSVRVKVVEAVTSWVTPETRTRYSSALNAEVSMLKDQVL